MAGAGPAGAGPAGPNSFVEGKTGWELLGLEAPASLPCLASGPSREVGEMWPEILSQPCLALCPHLSRRHRRLYPPHVKSTSLVLGALTLSLWGWRKVGGPGGPAGFLWSPNMGHSCCPSSRSSFLAPLGQSRTL
jgi:hypothetical protein